MPVVWIKEPTPGLLTSVAKNTATGEEHQERLWVVFFCFFGIVPKILNVTANSLLCYRIALNSLMPGS